MVLIFEFKDLIAQFQILLLDKFLGSWHQRDVDIYLTLLHRFGLVVVGNGEVGLLQLMDLQVIDFVEVVSVLILFGFLLRLFFEFGRSVRRLFAELHAGGLGVEHVGVSHLLALCD